MPKYDTLTKEQRSERMSRVKGKNTTPEIFVRRLVFSLGYRYRLHVQTLAGKPDLVFKKIKKVIFVHGCFWHLHKCNKYRIPKTRLGFWLQKLESNYQRDKKNLHILRKGGWKILTLWECELITTKKEKIKHKIESFLRS